MRAAVAWRSGLVLVVTAVAALAVIALQAFGQTTDPDIWWHLETGQVALSSPSALRADPFSFSFSGQPWAYKDLVAEVILFGGFRALGFVWFWILKLLIGVVCFVELRRIAGRGIAAAPIALIALTAFALTVPFIERPDLFSVGMAMVLLSRIDASYRIAAPMSRAVMVRAMVTTVIIQWIWCNLHRACMVGFLFQGLHAAAAVLVVVWHRKRPAPYDARWLLSIVAGLVGSGVASLFTLNGLALWKTSLAALRNDTLRMTISEWRPLTLGQYLTVFPYSAGEVIAAVCAIVVVLVLAARAKPDSAYYLLLITALLVLSFRSARWVTFLTLASTCALASIGGWILERRSPKRSPKGLTVLVALLCATIMFYARDDRSFALGEDPRVQPMKALDFAGRHGLDERVGNSFDLGGYVIWRSWPRVTVLVDGRNEVVYSEDFMVRALRSESDPTVFDQLHSQFGFSWVLAANRPGHESHRFLARHPDWAPVHWSDAAVIYVERKKLGGELIPYRELNPVALIPSVESVVRTGDGARIAALARELERLLVENPESVRALVAVFVFHDVSGPTHRAKRDAVLAELQRVAPKHPVTIQIMKRIR